MATAGSCWLAVRQRRTEIPFVYCLYRDGGKQCPWSHMPVTWGTRQSEFRVAAAKPAAKRRLGLDGRSRRFPL